MGALINRVYVCHGASHSVLIDDFKAFCINGVHQQCLLLCCMRRIERMEFDWGDWLMGYHSTLKCIGDCRDWGSGIERCGVGGDWGNPSSPCSIPSIPSIHSTPSIPRILSIPLTLAVPSIKSISTTLYHRTLKCIGDCWGLWMDYLYSKNNVCHYFR